MKLLFLPPLSQRSWKLPAIINFIFTSAGAGSYIISFHIEALANGGQYSWYFAAFRLLAVLFTCLGFLTVASEIRRHERTRYILRNVKSSWMSREILALVIFISSALIEYIHSSLAARTLAYTTALLLIISQGFMVYRSRALTAWNVSIMPFLFLSSGLVSGYGIILVVTAIIVQTPAQSAYMLGIILVILDIAIWLYYLGRHWSPEFVESTRIVRSRLFFTVIMGVGHAIPLLLLFLLMMNLTGMSNRIIAVASGLILFGSGSLIKAGIVMASGNVRGIPLTFNDNTE